MDFSAIILHHGPQYIKWPVCIFGSVKYNYNHMSFMLIGHWGDTAWNILLKLILYSTFPNMHTGHQGCEFGVGVGRSRNCFARSQTRSRQNLPTPTDSGQDLIPDSQIANKHPLFKSFFCVYFVVGWLDD